MDDESGDGDKDGLTTITTCQIHFQLKSRTNVTDGRTNGQTPHDGIGIASRGKNRMQTNVNHSITTCSPHMIGLFIKECV